MSVSSPNTKTSGRKLRLHFGGVWEVHDSSGKHDGYKWVGGAHLDTTMISVNEYTMESLKQLFMSKFPLTESHIMSFSYFVGTMKFDIKTNNDVIFLFKYIPLSLDSFVHIYCESPTIQPTQPPQPTQPSQSPAKTPKIQKTPKKKGVISQVDSPARNTRSKQPVRRKILPPGEPFNKADEVPVEDVFVDASGFPGIEGHHTFTELLNSSDDSGSQSEDSYEAMLNNVPGTEDNEETESDEIPSEQPTIFFPSDMAHEQTESPNYDEIEDHPDAAIDSEETESEPEDDSEDEDFVCSEEPVHDACIDELEKEYIEAEEIEVTPEEFMTQFTDLSKDTYDMTEESFVPSKPVTYNGEWKLFVGQQWPTTDECRKYIRYFGIKNKFEVKWQKNDFHRIVCRCKVASCSWRVYIRQLNDGFTMEVRSLTEKHTCESDGQNKNSMANAKWIAQMLEEDMRLHHASFTARDIITKVWHNFNVHINYWKAWNARNIALEMVHGNYEDSYMKIPELCRQIQCSNPDSVVQWECCPHTAAFEYLCVSFRASINGWLNGCRPIVGLDGCFLKGKYRGVCLCAIGLDGNNGMFPLAIFICRKEDGDNWDKFVSLIAPELKKHALPLTVMSDRAKGLINAVGEHFRGCNQRFCFRHMYSNLTQKYKGEHLKDLCWNAASTFRKSDFKKAIEEVEKAAPGAKSYLMKEQGPKTWARSHFDQLSKCDQLTNNFTESFNSFILRLRDKPICSLVNGVGFMLMKIVYDRKRLSDEWDDNGYLPRVAKVLAAYKAKENDYITAPSGDGTHCLKMYTGDHWTINLLDQACTCGEWQVTGIPCVHAVHLISHLRLPMCNYISPMLTVKAYKATYAENVKPIPHENDWSQDIETHVLPPTLCRGAGRPKNNRMLGQLEKQEKQLKNQKRCSKCGSFGHNSRGCKGGPTAAEFRGSRGRGKATRGSRGRGEDGIAVLARGRGFVTSGRGIGSVIQPLPTAAAGRGFRRGKGTTTARGSRGGKATTGQGTRGGRGMARGRGTSGGVQPAVAVTSQPAKKRKVFVPPRLINP